MHAAFNGNLKLLVHSNSRDLALNTAVPQYFQPEHIVQYLVDISAHAGIRFLTPSMTPTEFLDKYNRPSRNSTSSCPRDHNSHMTIRQLDTHGDELEDDNTSSPLELYCLDCDLTEDQHQVICALMTNPGPACDLCGSTAHLIAHCPKLKEILADRVKTDRLFRVLQSFATGRSTQPSSRGGPSSSAPSRRFPSSSDCSRPTTPTTNNRQIRQVELSHDDTDLDTDEEDASPDFP